uniref:WD repeat-containing protein 76 n=1 Tax=Crassostrea virginica TaxID=6565 RepID=A0A8B8CFM9_CRAVI|nr:WD repeat-containing protein 76-like [Crassostrea virginica]XP_022314598.1 WD repeat-containing protein 76-like [Crassostrea virginica]
MPTTRRSLIKRLSPEADNPREKKKAKDGLTSIKTEPKKPLTPIISNVQIPRSPCKWSKLEASGFNEETTNSEDEEEDEFDLEARRQKNLQDNAEIFSNLGFQEAKVQLQMSSTKYKPKSATKKVKAPKSPQAPKRRSMRLQRIDPEGQPLPELPVEEPPVDEHARKPSGPINMMDALHTGNSVEDHSLLMSRLEDVKGEAKTVDSRSVTEFTKALNKLTLRADRVAKVVPDRIFSLAIHPTEDKMLVMAGDKWGKLGFWDVVQDKGSDTDGIIVYQPHSRPINDLHVSPYNNLHVVSCSYDGTSRCCDLQKSVFDEVYATDEDDDNLLKNFDFLSADTIVYSQQDGTVALVDRRTPGTEAEHVYVVHPRSLRTVSVHPVARHLIVTASTDCTAKIWDIRNLKSGGKSNKWLDQIGHSKNVYSAYFSPLSGKYILTTSLDATLNVVECNDSGKLGKRKVIKHNNHVGRWLTPFRAAWHPAREDVFVVGSMERPRRIQVFDCGGNILRNLSDPETLGSVCSLNVFHPTQNILVGGNSSGRVHVFM